MLRVSAALRAELKIAAAIEELTISDVTEVALREWLTTFYRRKGLKPFPTARNPA